MLSPQKDIYFTLISCFIIYWAPKETIHSLYLKLFYSKNETLTFLLRNVILGILTHSFYTKYGFPTKDVDVDPPSVTWGSIYKITRLQMVHYLFIWTRCGWKLLNNWINFKVQIYHTLIVQNVETWTWRNFRFHADSVPSLFSIEMHNPFLDYNKPKSDIHCNRSATSPRPKFKTIAEVAEESQLGFAVGRRLVGDWSATNRGLIGDWSATGRRPRGDLFATWCNWSATSRGPVPDWSPTSRWSVADQVNLKL